MVLNSYVIFYMEAETYVDKYVGEFVEDSLQNVEGQKLALKNLYTEYKKYFSLCGMQPLLYKHFRKALMSALRPAEAYTANK